MFQADCPNIIFQGETFGQCFTLQAVPQTKLLYDLNSSSTLAFHGRKQAKQDWNGMNFLIVGYTITSKPQGFFK